MFDLQGRNLSLRLPYLQMIEHMQKACRNKITYTDGGKDVHLPLTNYTAFLEKEKEKRALLSTCSLLILS